jgi:hypothetical protein
MVEAFPDLRQGREVMYPIVVGTNTWTAMPAAEAAFGGSRQRYMRADLRHKSRCCMSAQVAAAGSPLAVLKLQYTTEMDGSGGWADLTSSAAIGETGYTESAEDLIPSGAKQKGPPPLCRRGRGWHRVTGCPDRALHAW